ncbi:Glycosyltransferase involved in cell wall biosynthesis [Planctomycetales bacterium 10988]|nr:Glycosyltransferase involved in cell wall biosynthesis [Planctomycetales bacterium 10988]
MSAKKLRILFLQKRPLFPANTGGKIRTLNILRHLAKWHEITYLCNEQPHEIAACDEMKSLGLDVETIPWVETPRSSGWFYVELLRNLASPYPYNVAKDFDPKLRKRAEELLKERPFDLVICDFVQMARNAIDLPAKASLLFQHNVEAEIFHRHAMHDHGSLRRRYMKLQANRMSRFEGGAGRSFDRVIAVSERDAKIFQEQYGWDHIRVIDTAVDTNYFCPSLDFSKSAFPNDQRSENTDKKQKVVFIGSMDWQPNELGVLQFIESTWPKIRQKTPDAIFQIVGRNPPWSVQQWDQTSGIEVTGTVPDVRPYLQDASMVVVPLNIGGGTRLKIFEAMAMGKAVVSTTLGAEGLPIQHGKHFLQADGSEDFSDAVISVLQQPERSETLGESARQLILEKYSAETVSRQFESICYEAVRQVEKTDVPKPLGLRKKMKATP